MKNLKNIIYFLVLQTVIMSSGLMAQDSTETVMFRAMKDELDRSMKQLVYKDYAKPFYISYTIEDVKTLYTSASLGSLTNSDEKRYRTWSNRILCGDYHLNDENFIDATRRRPRSDGNLQLPLDDDYFGIRRALWLMTNNTYKSAAENYKSKLAALKDKNLGTEVLEIPDFCQAPVVKKSFSPVATDWNKANLENLVKTVSSEFKKFPDIFYSEVSVYQIKANLYFYSSEQTSIKVPFDMVFASLSAYCQSIDGDNIASQIVYNSKSTKGLPSIESLKSDASLLAQSLIEKGNAPLLGENYSGPVLFLGQAASEILLQGLFNGTDNLCAYREPLYNNSQMSMSYGQNINSLEAKIDKPVIYKSLTIKDLTTLKKYNGIDLLGSYESDAEGVIPADTLSLIENGVLKTLYNGRTPTRKISNSNGHRRYVVQGGGITSTLAPGVVQITSSEVKSIDKLKEELIAAAKEEGLDYALMVKPIKIVNAQMPFQVIKVNVADGKEQLVRGASMNGISINSLKKISGISSGTFVYNTLLSGGYNEAGGDMPDSQQSIPGGAPVSVIGPDAILLKEIEYEHQTKALVNDKPIVKSPLK